MMADVSDVFRKHETVEIPTRSTPDWMLMRQHDVKRAIRGHIKKLVLAGFSADELNNFLMTVMSHFEFCIEWNWSYFGLDTEDAKKIIEEGVKLVPRLKCVFETKEIYFDLLDSLYELTDLMDSDDLMYTIGMITDFSNEGFYLHRSD